MKIGDCPRCAMYWYQNKVVIIEACASVALSRSEPTATRDMIVAYLSEYHRQGHRQEERERN